MDIKELRITANEVRKDIIRMLLAAGSGHSAGSLGLADIFVALYFEIMNIDPQKPDWERRDRLFLSCGHVAPVMYATMARRGYFPISELKTLRKLGSRLQGHPERVKLLGLESTSGPLGEGLAQASGYAIASKMDGRRYRIYCVTSDGEHQEGNHWEAVMFAGKYRLSNLTLFVDRNFIQISGNTEEVMPLSPLDEKYRAFGWNTVVINGHDFEEILRAVEEARDEYDRPTVIIAKTIPGKGVSFMEGRSEWHGKPPDKKESEIALKELAQIKREIEKDDK